MTRNGFSGEKTVLSKAEICEILHTLEEALRGAIERVTEENSGICPTYFYYEVPAVTQTSEGVLPLQLKRILLPLFLEGPTRWLRTKQPLSRKKDMVKAIRESGLYDASLRMYKLNEPLDCVSREVGRIRAFAPGWLENESVWLHIPSISISFPIYRLLSDLGLKDTLTGVIFVYKESDSAAFQKPQVYISPSFFYNKPVFQGGANFRAEQL